MPQNFHTRHHFCIANANHTYIFLFSIETLHLRILKEKNKTAVRFYDNKNLKMIFNIVQCSLDLVTSDLRNFRFKQRSVLENFFVPFFQFRKQDN